MVLITMSNIKPKSFNRIPRTWSTLNSQIIWGIQAIYRPILGNNFLFGEIIVEMCSIQAFVKSQILRSFVKFCKFLLVFEVNINILIFDHVDRFAIVFESERDFAHYICHIKLQILRIMKNWLKNLTLRQIKILIRQDMVEIDYGQHNRDGLDQQWAKATTRGL